MPEQPPPCPADRPSAEALRRYIDARTGRRIRHLRVDCDGSRVAVHGVAPSYYLKQLAITAVREVIPSAPVELNIQVS